MSAERQRLPQEGDAKKSLGESASAGRGSTVAGNELRAVLLFNGKGGIGLEAASAARFIGAHGADDDQLVTFDEALGMDSGIATADADGQQLGDFFGDGQQSRHGLEGAATVIGIQPGDDHTLAKIGELGAYVHDFVTEELRFVDADDLCARATACP